MEDSTPMNVLDRLNTFAGELRRLGLRHPVLDGVEPENVPGAVADEIELILSGLTPETVTGEPA
jgi:hypothetical protein